MLYTALGGTDMSIPVPESIRRLDYPGEWCKRCDRRNIAAWSVMNVVWDAVVQGRWNVLCPTCFDEEAQRLGVSYYFNEGTIMLTWSDWTAVALGQHPTLTTIAHEHCDAEACEHRRAEL